MRAKLILGIVAMSIGISWGLAMISLILSTHDVSKGVLVGAFLSCLISMGWAIMSNPFTRHILTHGHLPNLESLGVSEGLFKSDDQREECEVSRLLPPGFIYCRGCGYIVDETDYVADDHYLLCPVRKEKLDVVLQKAVEENRGRGKEDRDQGGEGGIRKTQ